MPYLIDTIVYKEIQTIHVKDIKLTVHSIK